MLNRGQNICLIVMAIGGFVWLADDLTVDTDWLGAAGLAVAILAIWVFIRLRDGKR